MTSPRLVLRNLFRSPGFAIYAILSLALGIGANTALFSVFDQILLKSLPVTDPARLVVFHGSGGSTEGSASYDNYETVFSYPMLSDLTAQLTAPDGTFDAVFARSGAMVSLAGIGEAQMAGADLVTGNLFDALGVRPALGRLIQPSDDVKDPAQPVVVLSNAFWKKHFGGRTDVVGQKLLVNNHPMEIAGVAPEGFEGVVRGSKWDVYLPIHSNSLVTPGFNSVDDRRSAWMNIFGRLKAGVDAKRAAAQAAPVFRTILENELKAMKSPSERLKRDFPARKLEFLPAGQGINVLRMRYESQLGFLMGMVGLILLIACANVANLFTVRAIGRRKEMAVRASLGATRGDIIRQLLAESLVLALAGGIVATLIGSWLETGLTHFVDSVQPGLDWRALAFNFALALGTAVVFGLLPAWQASRPDLTSTLKDEGGSVSSTRSQGRLRQVLALAQLALALVLLATAGLFARSLGNLQKVDLGFDTEHTLTFSMAPMLIGYTPERSKVLFDQVRQRLDAVPGVKRAATVLALPLSGMNMTTSVAVEGFNPSPDKEPDTHANVVSPGFFEAMGARLIAGRDFTDGDSAKAPKVAIVSEAFARKYLNGASPLGRHIGFEGFKGKKDIEIVGLAADQKTADLRDAPYEFVYLPVAQNGQIMTVSGTFAVRAAGDEKALANSVRQVVRELDPNLPIRDVKPMAERKADQLGDDQVTSLLTASFGVLATLLAALGLYAVLAFTVAQRTKEIGIRMALGATEGSVVKLVLSGMVRLMVAGLAIGLIGAYATGRWAESLLYGLKGFDPLVIAGAVGLLTLVAVVAATLPARRASRVDPVTALRQ